MEQQTPIPPKSRRKPREGQKRAIFPSLIWGEEGSRFSIYFVQDCSCSYFTPNRFWEQNPTVLQSRRGSNFTLTNAKKLRDFSIWWTLADYKNTGLNCLVVLTGFSRYCREPPFSFCVVSRWSAFLFILVQVSIDCHFKAWTRTKLLSNHSRISYDRHSSSVRIGFFPIKVIQTHSQADYKIKTSMRTFVSN